MAKPKVSSDPNVTAHNVLAEIMRRDELRSEIMREMGRKGGQIGGKARAERLTPERRKEIAQKAGSAPKRPRQKKD